MSEPQDEQDEQDRKPRLNLTTTQVAASALAACCASVVASYLGVAGTVIGAAVGSVVATTGAAIWAHLFRTGGDKIKQTLLVNGEPVEVDVDRADAEAASPAAVPAGRFYGTEAESATETADLWHPKTPTGETRVITDETARASAPVPALVGPRIERIKKYRKPMSIAAAIIAVFCISIVVGVFAGAPVRSAGSSSSPATTTTTTTTVTDTEHTQGQASEGSSASSGSSASPSSGSTSSATPSSSGAATSSSSAGSSASGGASSAPTSAATDAGQAKANATSTSSP